MAIEFRPVVVGWPGADALEFCGVRIAFLIGGRGGSAGLALDRSDVEVESVLELDVVED